MTLHIVAALAGGEEPHRMLSGHGPQGSWCGTGNAHPALAATETVVAVGAEAAQLDGAEPFAAGAADRITFDLDAGDVATALDGARSRLAALEGSARARSWLVAFESADGALSIWTALGAPSCSVAVRCWPGIMNGPDGTGEEGHPAALALAAESLCAAAADGRITGARLEAALAAAQGTTLAEGLLAERQARKMDVAGDVRGGAVRRLVAQAYAVDIALTGLREAAAAPGWAAADHG